MKVDMPLNKETETNYFQSHPIDLFFYYSVNLLNKIFEYFKLLFPFLKSVLGGSVDLFCWLVGWLVEFYSISTFVGYFVN